METFSQEDLKTLYLPPKKSHKGQNGKLTIVGGSHLFHGASLWALKVASRIVDMVFYSSIPENNKLTEKLKGEIFDFIAVPREQVEDYIKESDVVLIGPGLPRKEGRMQGEESTRELTERLIKKFPEKKWVIDAGSLTEMDPEWLKWLNGNVIITPHHKEFFELFKDVIPNLVRNPNQNEMLKPFDLAPFDAAQGRQGGQVQHDVVGAMAKKYSCVILLKGPVDIVCNSQECRIIEGGNEGMTKGGTGDVLAGLVAALSCKNDLFLAACAGSFINKKAGDELYKQVSHYFNASDLCDEIPRVMRKLLLG